jgi:hypothetical protein
VAQAAIYLPKIPADIEEKEDDIPPDEKLSIRRRGASWAS